MRLSTRAVLAVPVAAAVVLAGCSSSDPDETPTATDEETATEDATATDEPTGDETAAPEPPAVQEPTDLGEGVAALVGDEEITVAELDEALEPYGIDSTSEDTQTVRRVLAQLVQLELVEVPATEDLGIDLAEVYAEDAVQARADELIAAEGGEEAYAAALEPLGVEDLDARAFAEQTAEVRLLIDAIRDRIEADLAGDAFDEEEVREQYREDPSAYQASDVAHILVETEEEALDALERLEQGESFADLAAELSTGPSGPNGGELGVAPRGTYVPEFSDAVYDEDTEPGEVVGPVETQFGFHLIRVNEIITPTEDEVVEQARTAASEPAYAQFVTDAFGATEVTIDDDFGVWDPSTNTIVDPA